MLELLANELADRYAYETHSQDDQDLQITMKYYLDIESNHSKIGKLLKNRSDIKQQLNLTLFYLKVSSLTKNYRKMYLNYKNKSIIYYNCYRLQKIYL